MMWHKYNYYDVTVEGTIDLETSEKIEKVENDENYEPSRLFHVRCSETNKSIASYMEKFTSSRNKSVNDSTNEAKNKSQYKKYY